MSSLYGENIKLSIFGQSHSLGVGMTLDGIPAGKKIDFEALKRFLARRAPGRNEYSTKRNEADEPEFISGLVGDTTCGAPLTAIIRNTDTRSSDYSLLKTHPRPGHADYTAQVKYGGNQDYAGGGHFSGRLTAALCLAGGICKQLLEEKGIKVFARAYSIGQVKDDGNFTESIEGKEFPTISDKAAQEMKALIAKCKAEGDSIGGIIECIINGLDAGIGDPIFGGMENRLSQAVFGIPAVKGIEFGNGFECARLRGSENNDAFTIENGQIKTRTNNAGGLLGGITNGMPITFKVAFKPTPSIAKTQQTINLENNKEENISVPGRHDPCIVPRAVPCVEAAASIAVYDALLGRKKEI